MLFYDTVYTNKFDQVLFSLCLPKTWEEGQNLAKTILFICFLNCFRVIV